jgi:hypothetical protein
MCYKKGPGKTKGDFGFTDVAFAGITEFMDDL